MEPRKKQILFLVNESEDKLIREKMEKSGIKSLGAYMRKMAIEGYTIRLDLSDMREVVCLLRINSNNLNQYAKRANETGSVYAEDIKDLKKQQDEIWHLMKNILKHLSSI